MYQALIDRLVSAREIGAPHVPADWPLDGEEEAAYAVQAGVTEHLGPVGAYKCGRQVPDVIPVFAPVFAIDVYADGDRLAASNCVARGVELELGFRLLSDPPEIDDPDFEARLRERVELVPALEIVGSRLDVPANADRWLKLADNQNNEALVVGGRSAEIDEHDLEHFDIWLEIGGRVVHEGRASAQGGDAFGTFVAFARAVGTHAGGLQTGQVCITGALCGPHEFVVGDRVVGRIDGVGEVSIDIGD